ncbi:MAG: hypothetical protein RLZZ324_1072 [Candidatus Parcubacteria bacterium]|jgi:hypothetical protein
MRTCTDARVASPIRTRVTVLVMALLTAALVTGGAGRAFACGFCHNDKKASVYDAALLQRAKAKGLTVVYAEFVDKDGKLAPVPDDIMVQDEIRRAVIAASGARAADIRVVTLPSAALCFSYDPKKGSVDAVLARVTARLSAHGWRVLAITD